VVTEQAAVQDADTRLTRAAFLSRFEYESLKLTCVMKVFLSFYAHYLRHSPPGIPEPFEIEARLNST
jgi:hypothetical protein